MLSWVWHEYEGVSRKSQSVNNPLFCLTIDTVNPCLDCHSLKQSSIKPNCESLIIMMMGDTYFLFWLSVRTDFKVIAVKSQSGSGWLLATYRAELQVPEDHFLYDCATQLLPGWTTHPQARWTVSVLKPSGNLCKWSGCPFSAHSKKSLGIWGKGCPLSCRWNQVFQVLWHFSLLKRLSPGLYALPLL